VAAVQALLQRVLPEHAQLFALALAPPSPAAPHGCFSVEVRDGTVHVAGTSGVELASGVHWFLKHVACCSLSWHATGGLQVNAASLVQATQQARAKASIHRAVPWTWYMNVVTQSYSMAFWDWDRCVLVKSVCLSRRALCWPEQEQQRGVHAAACMCCQCMCEHGGSTLPSASPTAAGTLGAAAASTTERATPCPPN
jgi:hypothetical protein